MSLQSQPEDVVAGYDAHIYSEKRASKLLDPKMTEGTFYGGLPVVPVGTAPDVLAALLTDECLNGIIRARRETFIPRHG